MISFLLAGVASAQASSNSTSTLRSGGIKYGHSKLHVKKVKKAHKARKNHKARKTARKTNRMRNTGKENINNSQ